MSFVMTPEEAEDVWRDVMGGVHAIWSDDPEGFRVIATHTPEPRRAFALSLGVIVQIFQLAGMDEEAARRALKQAVSACIAAANAAGDQPG